MKQALIMAQKAYDLNEVPVGCVIVDNNTNKIVQEAHNLSHTNHNPLLHAEFIAITELQKKQNLFYFNDYSIYVTLEPCLMCIGMLAHLHIKKIVFGAYDVKAGNIEHNYNIFNNNHTMHKPDIIGGVNETECSNLLKKFFKHIRK